mmetsp:Transcript_84426/g.180837  ORF Transcript_84426/g.180837 Transcript_84426/m.180837 type:complete len:213 (+) Transcript_84426:468-1106(+)
MPRRRGDPSGRERQLGEVADTLRHHRAHRSECTGIGGGLLRREHLLRPGRLGNARGLQRLPCAQPPGSCCCAQRRCHGRLDARLLLATAPHRTRPPGGPMRLAGASGHARHYLDLHLLPRVLAPRGDAGLRAALRHRADTDEGGHLHQQGLAASRHAAGAALHPRHGRGRGFAAWRRAPGARRPAVCGLCASRRGPRPGCREAHVVGIVPRG